MCGKTKLGHFSKKKYVAILVLNQTLLVWEESGLDGFDKISF